MTDLEVVAKTLYGEARGEGLTGMLAVACVIRNRRWRGGWYGAGWQGVCLKPWQFSCWNREDPNRARLDALVLKDTALTLAVAAAKAVMDEALPDITNGANHYHASNVHPFWSAGEEVAAVIGKHTFYKL